MVMQVTTMVHGKMGASAANRSAITSGSWLAIRVFFSRMRMPTQNLAMITQWISEIEEIIIGEFENSDSIWSNGSRFYHINRGQSHVRKGAVTISKDTDKIGNFYIQAKKMGRE